MLKAVTRQATAVDAKLKTINASRDTPVSTAYYFDHYATPEDIAVMVTEEDFLNAHRELIPSVSAGELQHYEKVRATFKGGRDKKVEGNGGIPSRHAPAEKRASLSGMSRPTSRGKGKAVSKGKGKAAATSEDDEDDGSGDERMGWNGHGQPHVNGKGKGKAVSGFEEGTASDDDGLY